MIYVEYIYKQITVAPDIAHRTLTNKYIEDIIKKFTEDVEQLRIYSNLHPYFKLKAQEELNNAKNRRKFKGLADFSLMYELAINFNGFLLTSILDITIVLKNLLSNSKWENTFYMRYGCLIVYETLNTYNIYNKKLHQHILSKFEQLKPEFTQSAQLIRSFKKRYKHESHIATLRNKVAGHIDDDFLKYCKALSSIKAEEIIKCLSEFHNILTSLHELSTKIVGLLTQEPYGLYGKRINKQKRNNEIELWIDEILIKSPKMLS